MQVILANIKGQNYKLKKDIIHIYLLFFKFHTEVQNGKHIKREILARFNKSN